MEKAKHWHVNLKSHENQELTKQTFAFYVLYVVKTRFSLRLALGDGGCISSGPIRIRVDPCPSVVKPSDQGQKEPKKSR